MSALSRIIGRRGIPDPIPEIMSLTATVSALKEIVEELTRQRGNIGVSAVTVEDLVELGLLERRKDGAYIRPPAR